MIAASCPAPLASACGWTPTSSTAWSKFRSTITSVPPAIGTLSGWAAFAASASSHVVGWMKSIVRLSEIIAHSLTDRQHLLAVARGDEPADLVVRGARVLSVFTREWLDGDVAVAAGRFAGVGSYEGAQTVEAKGCMLVPGFVDAHVHIESSMLTLERFAEVVLAHGTTTVVADPHELANVVGAQGVHWLLDAAANVPLNVFVMAPSCVPASDFESPRGPLELGDMEEILKREGALGVAEMMNFPAVIAGDTEVLSKLAVAGATHVDGHAPGVTGHALNAYLAAGIGSDHEATTYEEALEKRRKGAWIMIREASNARNLETLLPLVLRHGPERCAFCTDDREADVLLDEGHIDGMCRAAVRAGLAVEDALVLASHNGAACHGLSGLGADCARLPRGLLAHRGRCLQARARLQGRPARCARRGGDPDRGAVPPGVAHQHGQDGPARVLGLRDSRKRRARARYRAGARPDPHRLGHRGAHRVWRSRSCRARAGPGQDRRDRAPQPERPGRVRVRARLRAPRGRVRFDRLARRAQRHRGRGLRRRHGGMRAAPGRARRGNRRRPRRDGPRRARPALRGTDVGPARSGGRAGPGRPAPRRPLARSGGTRPVHGAELPLPF